MNSRAYAFTSLFTSQLLSDSGDQVVLITLSWTLARGYGGAFLGLVLAIWAISRGVVLMIGGVIADRQNRRTVSFIAGLALACVVLAVSVDGAATTARFRYIWLLLGMLLGILDGIRMPIAGSLVPFVVEQPRLVHANRWMQLREWGVAAIGPALGGAIVGWGGSKNALLIAGVIYTLGALAILGLPSIPAIPRKNQSGRLDLRDGLFYVMHNEYLRVLLPTFALANLFVLGVFSVGIVLFAHTILHVGPFGLGLLAGVFSVGMAIGVLIVPHIPMVFRNSLSHLFVLFVFSDGMLALVGVTNSLVAAAILYGISGLLAGPPATFYRTWLQTVPPPEFLGRVASIARAVSFGLEPASAAMLGMFSRVVTANLLIFIAGACATAIDVSGVMRSRHLIGSVVPSVARDHPAEE